MYSYQAKSPKRERAQVLANQASRKTTPTAKRIALAAQLEALAPVAALDLARLKALLAKSQKT